MTISEFAPDTNCRRNGSGIISDFDSTAPPGTGSRDHSRRLDSSPVEQAKKWLIPIHRRANLTGTTSGVQSLGAADGSVCRHVPALRFQRDLGRFLESLDPCAIFLRRLFVAPPPDSGRGIRRREFSGIFFRLEQKNPLAVVRHPI